MEILLTFFLLYFIVSALWVISNLRSSRKKKSER